MPAPIISSFRTSLKEQQMISLTTVYREKPSPSRRLFFGWYVGRKMSIKLNLLVWLITRNQFAMSNKFWVGANPVIEYHAGWSIAYTLPAGRGGQVDGCTNMLVTVLNQWTKVNTLMNTNIAWQPRQINWTHVNGIRSIRHTPSLLIPSGVEIRQHFAPANVVRFANCNVLLSVCTFIYLSQLFD